MHEISILPAPEIRPAGAPGTAWERERRAFLNLIYEATRDSAPEAAER